jgi:dihydrofolate reductase
MSNHSNPIFMICAFSHHYVLGNHNKLPWNYPEDLHYFKEKTNNSIIIMGYNTYISLEGKKLKNRIHFVIDNTIHGVIFEEGVYKFSSLIDSVSYGQEHFPDISIFIIGGANLYEKAFRQLSFTQLYITYIDKEYEGDVYFPSSYLSSFQCISSIQSIKHPELYYQIWKPKLS